MATSLERRKEIEAQQAALRAYYRRNDTPTPAQTSAEAARKAREAEIQRAAENVSDWKRMRSTADRVLFHKPTTGLLSTVEGGVDFAMGLVGGVGGLFSEEFRDGVQDAIAYNATEEWVGKHLDELTKYSYTKDGKAGEIVDNVAQGVGQILPAVIVTIATAGAGAPSLVGEIASLAGTAVNAAGGATQEAYNEGAGYYEGLAYGTASGALEAGLEKLSEGTLGKLKGVGKGILDNALKGVAKTGVKRLAAEAVGEGVEEMVTEAATPLLKTIYKGKDAVAEYTDPAFYGQIGEAGLVGSLTSVATAGTLGKAFNPNGNPDIEASLDAIRTLETDADQYHMRDKLTAERYSDMKKAAGENLRNVEKVLQKASPEKRMKLMERYGLTEAFDQNGSLRVDFLEQSGFSTEAGQTGAPVPNAAKTQFSEYQSPSLTVGREHVEQAMAQITAELRQRDADAQAVERFDGTLDEASRSAYTKFKRAFGKLNREAGGRLSYVLVKPHSTFDGVRVGNTVYISADTLSNGKWVKTLIHEVTHVAEGTEAYQKYMKLLGEDAALVASAVDTVVNQKDYGFSDELAQRVAETEALDNLLAVQYNKKNRLINKTFPPYNESSSEANTLAVRWAKRMDVLEGQQKIISYHNQWYIIEKISNTDQGYQIVGTVKKSEYERKVAELKSYEREYTYATSLDEGISNYEYGDGGQSSDFAHVTDGQSNYNVSPMAEGERTGGAGAVPSKRDYQESNGAWQDNVTKSVKSEQSKSERNASPTVQYNRKQRTFKEGDETYGAEKGKNPKILGGQGAIRRIDRGRDSQRKQGDDPEKIYPWLGNDTTDGRAREKNGSGSSGWYRERSGNQLSVLRSGTGIFRNLRGRRVKATDTVGRAVSEKLRKRFANTVCKSEDGALLSLYHWTDAEFTTFAKGDIGFHFGTVQAAQRRCHQKQKEKRSTNISIYKEVYLNLCNPAVIDMDVMSWYVFPVSYKLNQQGIISNAELKILEACEGYYHSQYDSPAAVELRRILKEKGYDGIIYSNFNEGDISAIVFDADQIVTVAENGVDLERNNPTEQYSRESVAYIEKGSTNQLLNMNEISFPQPTSETSFDSNATNDSIPDSEKKVKSSRENSLTDETGARKTKTVPVSRGQMEKAREVFQKRLEAWDRKTDGFAFVMGETPSYLSDLEVQGKKIGKKQVRIDATKIKKIMQDHPEMTIEVIKHLPDLLNDPILVLDSKTVSGRLVLLGEVYAKEKPVMMALEINPTTRSGASTYVDVIKIASAYTRNNTQNMINTSKIRYIAENKSRVRLSIG